MGGSAPGARTAARGGKGRKRRKAAAGRHSFGREVLLTSMGCLWVILGLAIVIVSAGVFFGTRIAINVLEEIGQHDFAGPRNRCYQYEQYFASLNPREYRVDYSGPKLLEGIASYSWLVQPQGSNERRRFVWIHDLERNEVLPRTSPALCLDVKLGYITEAEAASYDQFDSPHEKYDPDDVVVISIVENSFSSIQPQDLQGWELAVLPEGPVSAPLIPPDEGAERQAVDESEGEEEPAAAEEADPNEATEVVDGSEDSADSEGDDATPISDND